jgi:hypothetical protein
MKSGSGDGEGGAPPCALDAARLIELPKIVDERGNLTFIEGSRHIPFEIRRVYYLYDVPGGAFRAGHAHVELHQFLVAMSGSFDVRLDDSVRSRKFQLNRSYFGLYIPPLLWREIDNFSSAGVCMALASDYFDESDYIREYSKFVEFINRRRRGPG